jgi:hemerythrin
MEIRSGPPALEVDTSRLFKWSSDYSVYLPEIDAEHQEIFRMAGDLHRAVLARREPAEIEELLKAVAAHAAHHFSHEEEVMQSINYPSYEWHKKQHDTARSKVKEVERRVRRGEPGAALEFLKFLADWLKHHTGVTDRMMGAYLRNYQRLHAKLAS